MFQLLLLCLMSRAIPKCLAQRIFLLALFQLLVFNLFSVSDYVVLPDLSHYVDNVIV